MIGESTVVSVTPRGAKRGTTAATCGREIVARSRRSLTGWLWGRFCGLRLVKEMTSGTIGTETNGVESTAKLSFVLWVAAEVSEFMVSMGKLTLISILARSTLLKRPAEFSLVATGVDRPLVLSRRGIATQPITIAVTETPVQFAVRQRGR